MSINPPTASVGYKSCTSKPKPPLKTLASPNHSIPPKAVPLYASPAPAVSGSSVPLGRIQTQLGATSQSLRPLLGRMDARVVGGCAARTTPPLHLLPDA